MKNKLFTYRRLFILLILLQMSFIFIMSTDLGASGGGMGGRLLRFLLSVNEALFPKLDCDSRLMISEVANIIIRKLAHLTEYAVLGGLVFAFLSTYIIPPDRKYYLSAAFSFLYAMSDELHQYFVPSRSCKFTDVMIDTAGAFLGAAVCEILYRLIMRERRRIIVKKDISELMKDR